MGVRRVCVIGAGVSGLVAVKSCLEEGLEPVCYERTADVGGLWNYSDEIDPERGSALYEGVVTNSSREMMCFSDFPFPGDTPPYLEGRSVIKYYQSYAEHFKLRQHIQFNTKVLRVQQTEDFATSGKWRVTVLRNGEETDQIFDAVMPATGFFSIPNQPVYPGEQDFEGSVIHCNEFRGNEDYRGKSVVVVGGSHSAGDVAVFSSLLANQVYLSTRSGTWVFPRNGPCGWPADLFPNRRSNLILPEWFRRYTAKKFIKGRMNHENLGLGADRELFRSQMMVNDLIQNRIFCGKVKVKTGIDHFTRKGVVFTDGTEVSADIVIYATGYKMRVPYIDQAIVQEEFEDLELYKHVFPPRLQHPTCALIGYVMPTGAHGPLFELQSRWAVQVFKGKCRLPPVKQMIEAVRIAKERSFERFGKHVVTVPPVAYQDDVASEFGALPSFKKLFFNDPALARKAFFGPCLPCTYRLVGPHPWEGARDTIMSVWDTYSNAARTRASPGMSA